MSTNSYFVQRLRVENVFFFSSMAGNNLQWQFWTTPDFDTEQFLNYS